MRNGGAEPAEVTLASRRYRAALKSPHPKAVSALIALKAELAADLAATDPAELVLGSAGIETTVDVDSMQVSAAASRMLAAVVREAVTNILRHSDARKVSITFEGTEPCSKLVIVNDRARRPKGGTAADGPLSGTGLAALAAQCAAAGGDWYPARPMRQVRGTGRAATERHRTTMTDTTIRVLIAPDEELIREALVALLERETDIEVQMPVIDGVGVVTELSRQLPACAGVILTGHGRPHLLRQALTSGARGFIAKGAPSTALADVVRRVHEGHRYVDPILAADALTAAP